MESIEMKIAKTAAKNWGQAEPTNLEEAKGITWGSEISSIKGIVSVLGLNPELEQQITEDVYTKDTISEDIANQINGRVDNTTIINMLSVVHDEWVKNNPNNFLRVNKDENGQDKPRNKEYQFVPLEMLSWKEAKSDLLFLKPILEAAGVEINEESLQQQFEIAQKEFLIDHNIYSKEELQSALKYYNIYPVLDGLETKNGGNIRDLLKNNEISDKMSEQIMGQIDIKSKEDLLKEIQESENPLYNDEYHVESDKTYKFMGETDIDEKMSMRDILISKLTEDRLREENAPKGEQNNFTFTKTGKVLTPKDIAKASQEKETTKGEVSKVKAFFDRILGRDNKVTENDGRNEK